MEPNIFCLHRQKIFAGSGKRRLERKQASFTTSENQIRKEASREWEGTVGVTGDVLSAEVVLRALLLC